MYCDVYGDNLKMKRDLMKGLGEAVQTLQGELEDTHFTPATE